MKIHSALVLSVIALSASYTHAQATVRDAYALTWKGDVPMGIGAAGLYALGQWRLTQMTPYTGGYDKSKLMVWDRPFAGRYNKTANSASDVLSGAAAFPVVLSLVDWKQGSLSGSDVGTQVVMLSEVLSLESGLNLLVRSFEFWPRPLMLGDQGGAERSARDASGSFYSGHSSAAFAVAVFSGVWFDRTHPGSKWSSLVWGGALATATTVAVLRVVAGKHYPSDVVVGALVGSGIGWVVPKLHERSASPSGSPQLAVAAMPGGAVLSFSF